MAVIALGIGPRLSKLIQRGVTELTLRPAFPASRLQHISDLHSKFALRPHHV